MTLAFFYLVIGDLIIIHQKAIYNYDIFGDQPMSAPDKSAKSIIFKLNDKKNKTNNSLLSFDSKSEEENSIFFQEYYSLVNPLDVSFKLFYNKYSSLSFRGPPIKLYFS